MLLCLCTNQMSGCQGIIATQANLSPRLHPQDWFCLLHHNSFTPRCILYIYLYPTYDVDQRYRQGNICDIALWLGQYHDIAL